MGKQSNSQKTKKRNFQSKNDRKGSTKEFDAKEYGKKRIDDPHAANDISWYVPTDQILKDAASLPFSNTLDSGVNVVIRHESAGEKEIRMATPGLCVLKLSPSLGRLYDTSKMSVPINAGTDPINIASKAIYSYVRHANSGSANYDSSDLMMYLLAMDNIYMIWSYLVRMYGIARTYNFYNKYTPEALLHGMGIDNPDLLAGCLADLRALINQTAIRISSFAVPTVMPYFKRHLWLYQNVFLDSPAAKAQMYMFTPAMYYKYNEVAGTLDDVEMPRFDATTSSELMQQIRALVEDLLEPIITSESIGIMSGDILKSYGASNIYGFSVIDENFTVVPAFVDAILPQIHNATVLGVTGNNMGPIEQDVDTGYIYQTTNVGSTAQPVQTILNVRANETDPTGVMYATRLMTLANGTDEPYFTGSEVVSDLYVYPDARDLANNTRIMDTFMATANTEAGLRNAAIRTELLSKFNWAPQFYHFTFTDNVLSTARNWVNYDTFTTINNTTLAKIHDCAISGEFGIPVTLVKA